MVPATLSRSCSIAERLPLAEVLPPWPAPSGTPSTRMVLPVIPAW
jgi:hypothetical protein